MLWAMNNRITDIVTGVDGISGDYGVAFVDLNGLKTVNDEKGHTAGDHLLQDAAVMLKETFTDSEIFRVGGDEFLVIVTGHNEDEFNAYVKELRDKSDKSEAVKFAIGTCFEGEDFDIRGAMHLADERMYKDKEEFYDQHPELQRRLVTR